MGLLGGARPPPNGAKIDLGAVLGRPRLHNSKILKKHQMFLDFLEVTESSFELIGVAVVELCSNKRTLVLSTGLRGVKERPLGRRQAPPPKMEPKSALGATLGQSWPSWGRLGASQAAKRKNNEKTRMFIALGGSGARKMGARTRKILKKWFVLHY